ncbi:MAG TPA: serine hydrolase domain-containing protein [Steroidobacteraceae bacterium]|jgi:CubicO group peptidase (beta-lactamase class C family)|nr:serine hydrolase domain-containing protein [Steroidobacteraceae bacterium]
MADPITAISATAPIPARLRRLAGAARRALPDAMLAIVAGTLLASAAAAAEPPALAFAKPDTVGLSGERLGRLDVWTRGLIDQGSISGAVTLVARHGKVVELAAAGKRDLAANLPMEKDSIFRIYSMSKPITGVALMMLFEEGKWQLNDPVANYVPQFSGLKVYATDARGNVTYVDQKHPMTMRELMSHTAGFTYGYFSNTPVDKLQIQANLLDPSITLDEFIERLSKLPLNAQPGSEWHYSVSVDVQGYIVQKLSGMPFEDFLAKRIFAPLGMRDTGFYVPAGKIKRLAQMYDYDAAGKLRIVHGGLNHDFAKKPALASGGGGLVSTAADYLRFCQMLLNGGELGGVRLLSPRTVELMRSDMLPAGVAMPDPGLAFGLDFAIEANPVDAGGYYGKGTYFWGGAAGTWFWIDPVEDLIVIGMIQQVGSEGRSIPDMRGLSHSLVYQAITH